MHAANIIRNVVLIDNCRRLRYCSSSKARTCTAKASEQWLCMRQIRVLEGEAKSPLCNGSVCLVSLLLITTVIVTIC